MTGAPMPEGADAIVMVEVTHADGDDVVDRRAPRAPAITCARRAATSRAGDAVFAVGTVLTPAHIGVLASLGIDEVRCHPRPRVGVISTGDELVESGPLAARPHPRLEPADAARRRSRSRASSRSTTASRATTRTRSRSASRPRSTECDALLTSGAVSMGDYDYVKVVLEAARARRGRAAGSRGRRSRSSPPSRSRSATLGRGAGVRAARQPGVVARELRAVRPARAARSSRAGPMLAAADRARDRRAPRSAAGPTASCTSTGSASSSRTAATSCERAGFQASNVLSGMAAANGLALIPDGAGVDAGGEVEVARARSVTTSAAENACQVFTERGTTCTLRRTVAGRASRGSQRRLHHAWQPEDAWLDAYFGTRRGY